MMLYGMSTLIPVMIVMMLQIPMSPPRGDTLRIDEEAEAYSVEEYTHQHDQEVFPEVLGDRLMREFMDEILELLAEERQQIEILCHCYLLVRLVEVKLL